MDKKLTELLDTIAFPEDERSSFFNMSLKRVKVSKNQMRIILEGEVPLELDIYLKMNQLYMYIILILMAILIMYLMVNYLI